MVQFKEVALKFIEKGVLLNDLVESVVMIFFKLFFPFGGDNGFAVSVDVVVLDINVFMVNELSVGNHGAHARPVAAEAPISSQHEDP